MTQYSFLKIRRIPINETFSIIEKSNLFASKGSPNQKVSFVFIPRYNVGIQLNWKSINYFFQYIYKIRTIKTYFIWILLQSLVFTNLSKIFLPLTGLSVQILTPKNPIDHSSINVIFFEWHFLGIYNFKLKKVAHILSNSNYRIQLSNEIECRKQIIQSNIENIPKLIDYSISDKGYWMEEIAVQKNGQFISEMDFISAQNVLLKIYHKTSKQTSLNQYLKELELNLKHVKANDYT